MTVAAQTLGPGVLSFTVDGGGALADFSSQVTACEVDVSTDTDDAIDVLSGEQIDGDSTETFTLKATFLQDLTAAGVIDWSWVNAGDTAAFIFVPNTEADRSVTGTVRVRRLNIGGDVKKKNTSDVEFSVIGTPTFGPAA